MSSDATRSSRPQRSDDRVDVLIVGAGPTGLTLAAELASRGIDHRLIDAADGPSETSRALNVQLRTLELMRMWGMADALIDRGVFPKTMLAWKGDEKLIELDMSRFTAPDSPYDGTMMISQADTEAVLRERLAAVGGEIEWSVALDGYAAAEGRVTAWLKREGGETETVVARYMVGCDGAHSVVRHGADFDFEGETYGPTYIQADAQLGEAWDRDVAQVWLTDEGPFGFLPLNRHGLFRISTTEFDPSDDPEPLTADDFVDRAAAVGVTIDPGEILWTSRFRIHHRMVDRLREGPIFLAGDAAHLHSPTAGQGLNTGIQDGFNLGWKLAAVLDGEADPSLLDTYASERLPVAAKVLSVTDTLFHVLSSSETWSVWLRNTLLPLIAPLLKGDASGSAALSRFMSQLDVRYHGFGGEAEGAHSIDGGWAVGLRAPDAVLREGGGAEVHLHDAFGRGWVLVCFLGPDAPGDARADALDEMLRMADRRGISVRTVAGAPGGQAWTDPDGAAHTRYGLPRGGVYLVRPDGHIAWRGAGFDVAGIEEWLASSPMHFGRARDIAA